MSLPTRHWSALTGMLTQGQRAVVAHGLYARGYPASPDAVLLNMGRNTGPITSHTNLYVEQYASPDSINVYLSNVDPTNAHPYSIIARTYHSIEGRNF